MRQRHESNTQSKVPIYPRIGVGILVEKEGKVLLGQRKGSHAAYTWAPPGGHLEFGESVEDCAKRELLEETGLLAHACHLGPWVENVMENGSKHYITIFVSVSRYEGIPENLEPEKCVQLDWFSWDTLPTPLFPAFSSFCDLQARNQIFFRQQFM